MNLTKLMTTLNSKKIAGAFLALIFAFSLLLPALVFAVKAEENDAAPSAVKAKANAGLCAKIEDFYSRSITQLADKEAKYQSKKLEREKVLMEKYAERAVKQDKARANWDNKSDALFSKLEDRAGTDEQKQAAAAYEQAVSAAVTARRVVIDAALAQFNASLAEQLKNRQIAFEAALAAYKTAASAAQEKAKAACSGEAGAQKIRAELKAGLKAARQKLAGDIKALDKIKVNLSSLVGTKKGIISQANADFKAALAAARAELKAALAPETDADTNTDTNVNTDANVNSEAATQ